MNRDEVIKTFKDWVADYKVQEEVHGLMPWQRHRMRLFAIALDELEKQTTKYEHIGTRLTYWGKHKYIFKCETCGLTKEFTDNHTAQYKYCPSCGRKIDWSKPKGDSYDFAIIDEAVAQKGNKDD